VFGSLQVPGLQPSTVLQEEQAEAALVGQEMEVPVMEKAAGLWPGGKVLLCLWICSSGTESVPQQR